MIISRSILLTTVRRAVFQCGARGALTLTRMAVGNDQWSNYEGARGGLAPLKGRVAPSKHLV